ATAAVFAVEIETIGDTPAKNGMNTLQTPTHVVGQACHGRPINSIQVNGKTYCDAQDPKTACDLKTTTHNPGTEDETVTVTVDIDTHLAQTDLLGSVMGTNLQVGTLDRGANTLYITAQDDVRNRTSSHVNFTLGNV